jgi:hypothetical protein
MTPQECCLYYYETGRIPPVNLVTWVSVYNIITQAGYGKLV